MADKAGGFQWSEAWADAIAAGVLGSNRNVGRGRGLAARGGVHSVEVEPGQLSGRVDVAGGEERLVPQVGIRPMSDEQWRRLIDLIVEHGPLSAAVLTGELPFALHELSSDVGAPVMPEAEHTSVDCTCPEWSDTCVHAVALGFVLVDIVSADPWSLLLLRGRDRSDLIDAIRTLRADRAGVEVTETSDEPREPDLGVPAAAAHRRTPTALPTAAQIPRRPGEPVLWATAPPADSGLDLSELRSAAADAAVRAVEMLANTGVSGAQLSVEADIARRAHRLTSADDTGDMELLRELAVRSGRSAEELETWALAWGQGGEEGFVMLTLRWEPAPPAMEPAVSVLGEPTRISRNVASKGSVQLRLDQDGCWWRFEADDRLGWILASGAFGEPGDALDS